MLGPKIGVYGEWHTWTWCFLKVLEPEAIDFIEVSFIKIVKSAETINLIKISLGEVEILWLCSCF